MYAAFLFALIGVNSRFTDLVAASCRVRESMTKHNLWAWTKRLLPVAIGATAGFAYYYFIGCVSGTCPITSNPWISTAYGALLGFFILPSCKKQD
jgi:hypothetical protein